MKSQMETIRAGTMVSLASLAAAAALMSVPALAAPISTVFVIAMENHDLTQPGTYTNIQPILGNAAAPYINSLMTPGNPNAAYTSYATNMTNVAPGVHPSEPNYIWENAGSNFGVATDADPSAGAGNIINSPSMTGQMTAKGITWNSYQEDVQYSTSPLVSASGTGGVAPNGVTVTTNPYNGSNQYNFAVKHNPSAFFTDSNTAPGSSKTFTQLQTDIANNTYARYNWITPDQYNEMHSSLTGGFTYDGVHYTGDQAAVAEGDNFLSIMIPELEATNAFQDGTGMIEIWFDESEGGDTADYTIPEIIISKDAVGNAFDVTEALTHSADLATMDAIYGLPCLGAACSSPTLRDFFQAGALPEPTTLAVLGFGLLGVWSVRRRGGSRAA
jgi:phosphatidylinositol-3-phosphatase